MTFRREGGACLSSTLRKKSQSLTLVNKIVGMNVSRAYFLTSCVIIFQHTGAYLFVIMHFICICINK